MHTIYHLSHIRRPRAAARPGTKIHETRQAGDKVFVNAFLRNAEEIFSTARQQAGDDCEISVLIGDDGGIHMVYGSDWGLEPLRQFHGAAAAYRVTRTAGAVALDGRSLAATCHMETAQPARLILGALSHAPCYRTAA
jgi:hypothetical protein